MLMRKFYPIDYQGYFLKNNRECLVLKHIEGWADRKAKKALVLHKAGVLFYCLLNKTRLGNALPSRFCLKSVPLGFKVFNLETSPGTGAKLVRAPACFSVLVKKTKRFVFLLLPSGKLTQLSVESRVFSGVASLCNESALIIKKAGHMRWLGKRPKVRGSAMNPCDHKLGGGNGKSRGKFSVNPWGKLVKK